jgi:hypothetical protein
LILQGGKKKRNVKKEYLLAVLVVVGAVETVETCITACPSTKNRHFLRGTSCVFDVEIAV